MGKNQDPGPGINIPDPQHCLIGVLQSLAMWPTLAEKFSKLWRFIVIGQNLKSIFCGKFKIWSAGL
jgi:hypothetical protein